VVAKEADAMDPEMVIPPVAIIEPVTVKLPINVEEPDTLSEPDTTGWSIIIIYTWFTCYKYNLDGISLIIIWGYCFIFSTRWVGFL